MQLCRGGQCVTGARGGAGAASSSCSATGHAGAGLLFPRRQASRVGAGPVASPSGRSTPSCSRATQLVARAVSRTGEKWWERETPNMRNIHGVQELVDQLADAGDALVIVDFYGQWCGACRALYPKLLKLMEAFPDVVFLKVDFDQNKELCKALGVKVLPMFQVYRGAEGRVASFSCSVSKFQRMRDALEEYYSPICSLEDNPGLPEFPDIVPHPSEVSRVAGYKVAAADERLAAAPPAGRELSPVA